MSENFKWHPGRQGSGYERMKIYAITFPISMDCYVLRMKEGSSLPSHKDPMRGKWRGKKHYRMNLVICKPEKGGEYWSEKSIINWPRFKLLRPDLYKHGVSEVEKGTRYVLSFGFAI